MLLQATLVQPVMLYTWAHGATSHCIYMDTRTRYLHVCLTDTSRKCILMMRHLCSHFEVSCACSRRACSSVESLLCKSCLLNLTLVVVCTSPCNFTSCHRRRLFLGRRPATNQLLMRLPGYPYLTSLTQQEFEIQRISLQRSSTFSFAMKCSP